MDIDDLGSVGHAGHETSRHPFRADPDHPTDPAARRPEDLSDLKASGARIQVRSAHGGEQRRGFSDPCRFTLRLHYDEARGVTVSSRTCASSPASSRPATCCSIAGRPSRRRARKHADRNSGPRDPEPGRRRGWRRQLERPTSGLTHVRAGRPRRPPGSRPVDPDRAGADQDHRFPTHRKGLMSFTYRGFDMPLAFHEEREIRQVHVTTEGGQTIETYSWDQRL